MGTAIELYKPQPAALEFHKALERFLIMRGSNRAGKTLCSSVEAVMICMGIHPWKSGETVPKEDGKFMVVGKDAPHLADPLWRTLAYPGAFWVIPDADTGELRPLRINRTKNRIWMKDQRRRKEWRPAPPLITENNLAEPVAWSQKNRGIPAVVQFKTGWEMKFHTAEGNPRQGVKMNAAWFDEEIPSLNWWRETQRGLIDGDGIFWWSATPQDGSLALYSLHQKAEAGDPEVAEFFLHIKDNPYLTETAKQSFYKSLLTEEDIRVCWDGEYKRAGYLVYPEIDIMPEGEHFCNWTSGNPPYDWMKFTATDPGHVCTATLFGAMSPEGEVHIYDELYLKGTSASEWAPKYCKKLTSKDGYIEVPEVHIFDMQFGRNTTVTGTSVVDYYQKAAGEQGVRNRTGGRKFATGNKDVLARTEATKDALAPDPNGQIKIRIDPARCPNLIRELSIQRWREGGRDKRENIDDHLVDTFEYLVSYPLQYRKPKASLTVAGNPEGSSVANIYKEKLKRKRGGKGKKISQFTQDYQDRNKEIFDLTPGADHRVYYPNGKPR